MGGLPWGVAAASGRAYVANFGAGTVSVIDLVEQKVLQTVPVGLYPVGAVAGADGAYVVHMDGSVVQLDNQGRILARTKADAPDRAASPGTSFRHDYTSAAVRATSSRWTPARCNLSTASTCPDQPTA